MNHHVGILFTHPFGIFLLIACCLVLPSCGDDDPTMIRVRDIPREFRLVGEAHGGDSSGSTVDCELNLLFELRTEELRTERAVRYSGVHGGEVFRRVLGSDNSGFGFFVDVFGEVEVLLFTETGQVTIFIPINETAEGRFWQQMSQFHGVFNPDGTGSGKWTCAPLDIDQNGYMDTSLTAQGTWRIEPL